MSIKFSEAGPSFPSHLVDSLLAGDVVFLCGAGVSAPQLPGFERLVNLCFANLSMQMTPSEQQSFEDCRFEEVLGSLSRRLVDPTALTQVIMNELRPSPDADLNHHRTIVRLSRNLDNRPVIITTNFDTMLEQALLEYEDLAQVRALSFAGQDLPPPSSNGFNGIIHLHGRIDDTNINIGATPLVITSSDYGDAYMRSGWASRFLFDLCRCKTIVLIGYSAGDAPVRYFLNVIESDRQRFSDLKRVYAFTDVTDHGEPDSRWEALAVTPITYEKGAEGHEPLWRDLESLAEVVERPRVTRRTWACDILSKLFSDTNETERNRLIWLLRDRRDLWSTIIQTIEDSEWFEFFDNNNLWSKSEAAWVLAAWVARGFSSPLRFRQAIAWRKKLGKQFSVELSRRLRRIKGLSDFWFRAWRLLSISPPERNQNSEESSHAVQQLLRGQVVFNADIEKAINLLTPVLELSPRQSSMSVESVTTTPERLEHLIWARLHIVDRVGGRELLNDLVKCPQVIEIMTITTAKLQAVIGLAIDFNGVRDDYDCNDSNVPSVEPHQQNDHHDGVVLLIELLARLLPLGVEKDRVAVRALADIWRALPGKLGVRLWLHALRNSLLFSSDEVITGLTSMSISDFWSTRRELPLVLQERTENADTESLTLLEERILTQGDTYFTRYTIEEGQVDWRSHARDTAVWLRLKMLAATNALSAAGIAELKSIQERRRLLDREVEDRDFFGSYSSGVRTVVGDVQPILNAQNADRLDIARKAIQSPDIEMQLGWSAYCRIDPRGAFDTLAQALLDDNNAPLWGALLESLSFSKTSSDPVNQELIITIFAALEPATYKFLVLIIDPLVGLYSNIPWRAVRSISAWRHKLFTIVFSTAEQQDTESICTSNQVLEEALNSSAGRLTQATLIDIEELRGESKPITFELVGLIVMASTAEGHQGLLAKAALIEASGFVFSITALLQVHHLLNKALAGDSADSKILRSLLVTYGRLTTTATRAFKKHILLGLIEFEGDEIEARAAAAKIIEPALSIVREDVNSSLWGLTLDDITRVLKEAHPALREGVVDILQLWINQIDGGPSIAWNTSIGPLLAKVWPRERVLRNRKLSHYFAGLIVRAEKAFPVALNWALPYLDAVEGQEVTLAIEKSEAPEQFPRETLTLLWALFGIGSSSDRYGIPEILDRLVAAEPQIELDRRLQWLDQQALRYD